MQSKTVNLSNKSTPGKHYRSLKQLRKPDVSAEIFPTLSPDLLKYMEILNAKGLQIHKHLALASFKTRNSLMYTGIIATNYLTPNEILLKIPRNLLLTTKTAYFSELQVIFNENPDFYSRYIDKNWEDNILLTFLLHEYQKKELSYWHFLIKLLPKDIDYLAFWSEKELDLLEDQGLKIKAFHLLSEFEEIFIKLSEILSKYPDIFMKETFSYENVKWIHIHLITRSFGGKYLNYVTMVPFAEFFNHECTNVYYDFMQNEITNTNENESNCENKNVEKFTEDWEENLSTSNESNQSEESHQDEDFADIKGVFTFEDGQNEPILDKKLIDNEDFAVYFREILEWIINTIDLGDVISCFYFNEILKKLTDLKKKCLKSNNKKNRQEIKQIFSNLQVLNLKYKYHLLQYMAENKGLDLDSVPILSQKKIFSDFDKPKPDPEALKLKKYSDPTLWKDDDFEYMILKNSEKDFFRENSQVYFCYGRLSNRKLLQRYGMALEFNKYDNAVIRVRVVECVKAANQDFINYLNNFKLKKCRSFKLRSVHFNLDFLLFARGANWDIDSNSIEELFEPLSLELELKALNFMKKILGDNLKKDFGTSFEENSELVNQKKFNYHEHFAIIYRLEKQRILLLNQKLVNVAIEIIKRMQMGMKLEEAKGKVEEIESQEEWERNRWLLKGYLEKFLGK